MWYARDMYERRVRRHTHGWSYIRMSCSRSHVLLIECVTTPYREEEMHTCARGRDVEPATLILNWLLIHVNYHRPVYRDFAIS